MDASGRWANKEGAVDGEGFVSLRVDGDAILEVGGTVQTDAPLQILDPGTEQRTCVETSGDVTMRGMLDTEEMASNMSMAMAFDGLRMDMGNMNVGGSLVQSRLEMDMTGVASDGVAVDTWRGGAGDSQITGCNATARVAFHLLVSSLEKRGLLAPARAYSRMVPFRRRFLDARRGKTESIRYVQE